MSGSSYNLYLNLCLFFKCSCSDQGGSIFINSANIVTIIFSIFENSKATRSSSFRIGYNPQTVQNEIMNNTLEIYPSASGHGSVHSTKNFNFFFNNKSNSKHGSVDFYLTYITSNGPKFSNFNNCSCQTYICFWTSLTQSKFICNNFINISCNTFLSISDSNTNSIYYELCYFKKLYYEFTSNKNILEFQNCYFSSNSFDTSKCKLFIFNYFNINYQYLNLNKCNFIINNEKKRKKQIILNFLFYNFLII